MIVALFTYPDMTTEHRDLKSSMKGLRKNGVRPISCVIVETYKEDYSDVHLCWMKNNLFKGIYSLLDPRNRKLVIDSKVRETLEVPDGFAD